MRGRPWLGLIDGVKVALGNREMTLEAARPCAKDRKEWRALVQMQLNEFHGAIFAWNRFFQTALPCSGGYRLARGSMPLHDAVMINCITGAASENHGAGVKYMG